MTLRTFMIVDYVITEIIIHSKIHTRYIKKFGSLTVITCGTSKRYSDTTCIRIKSKNSDIKNYQSTIIQLTSSIKDKTGKPRVTPSYHEHHQK